MKASVELATLTPLWTGGAQRKVDRVHETGVIGSLRWWCEAVVRGLGGLVCDPTEHKCLLAGEERRRDAASKGNKQPQSTEGLCDVCRVFGATGWQRRFRLVIRDRTSLDNSVPDKVQADRRYTNDKGGLCVPSWWLPSKPRSGRLSLGIQSLFYDFQPEVIAGLVQFIADWGTVGAKPQMGFGVVKVVERVDTRAAYEWFTAVRGNRRYPRLPSLRNMFFARIRSATSATASIQKTFDLKYDLRSLFSGDAELRHFVMGTIRGEHKAAKIRISLPYDGGVMRVWGWMPEEADVYRDGWGRETIVRTIYEHLARNYDLQVWRELDSPRDTETPKQTDPAAFLRSLLGLGEESRAG